jgi:WD40 repeat protein
MQNIFRLRFIIWIVLLLLVVECKKPAPEKRTTPGKRDVASSEIVHHKGILDIRFLPGNRAITIGRDSLLILWDLDSAFAVKAKRLPFMPLKLAFNEDVHHWWVACKGGTLYRFSLPDLTIQQTVSTVLSSIGNLEYSRFLHLFFGQGERGVFRFDPAAKKAKVLPISLSGGSAFALHSEQPLLAIFSGNAVVMRDVRTLKPVRRFVLPGFKNNKDGERHLRFAGNRFLVAAYGEDVWLINRKSSAIKKFARSHLAPITTLAFSPQQNLLATAGMDKSIKLWNIPDGSLFASLYGHFLPITALDFGDSGRVLLSAAEDGNGLLWDVPRKKQKMRLGSLRVALRNPWKLVVKRVSYARSFKVRGEEYNVSDRNSRLLKIFAEIKNTGPADNMFFSSNLYLIGPNGGRFHCMGLENFVALGPKAYFKQRIGAGKSLKGNFIFVIKPPYREYSLTYETLNPISLKGF